MVDVVVPYNSGDAFSKSVSWWGFKLLLQEMAAMGIDVQIKTGHADRSEKK